MDPKLPEASSPSTPPTVPPPTVPPSPGQIPAAPPQQPTTVPQTTISEQTTQTANLQSPPPNQQIDGNQPQSTEAAPPPPSQPPSAPPSPLHRFLANKKLVLLLCGGLLLLLIISTLALALSGSSNAKPKETTKETTTEKTETKPIETKPDDSQTIVYGAWTSQQSVIKALNTKTGDTKALVSLPLTVKKVSVLNNKQLLYIDRVDAAGFGARVSIYDLEEKQITINVPAKPGLKIADYVLSPNKQYLALWELSLNAETKTLAGGQSSVYTVDLTKPTVENKLFSEPITTTPVHYPRAILDDGTVFTDSYLPKNNPTDQGYEQGLSVIDADGTNQKDILAVPAGTYSSQPVLSPDQKYLLFAGYTGTDGTATRSGVRQAILSPNTINILNTQSLKRFTLPNLPAGSLYGTPQWDELTGNPIIPVLSSTSTERGVYSYDLGKEAVTKLPFTFPGAIFLAQLPNNQTLIGTQSTDKANIGNLGPTETYAYTQLTIVGGTEPIYLSSEDPYMQYITVLPGNYFSSK